MKSTPISIRKQIIYLILAVTLILLGLYIGITLYTMERRIDSELKTVANETGIEISNLLSVPLWELNKGTVNHIVSAAMANRNLRSISMWDDKNTPIISLLRDSQGQIISGEKHNIVLKRHHSKHNIEFDGRTIGELHITYDGEQLRGDIIGETYRIIATTTTLITIIILLIYISISKKILIPLSIITESVKQISGGNLSRPLDIKRKDEIGQLAKDIEEMRISIIGMHERLDQSRVIAEEREAYVRLLLANSNDIIQIIDTRGYLLFASDSMNDILGYMPQDFSNRTTLSLIHEEDIKNVTDTIREMVKNPEKNYRLTYRYKHKSSNWIDLEAVACNLSHINSVGGILLNIRDISERRDAENRERSLQNQIHQSQKMEAIGQLAGGVAHDFNNALAGIMGAADLLKMEEEEKGVSTEYAELIITAAERARDLTQKLLTFSRKEKISLLPISSETIVKETVALLTHTLNKNITIEFANNAKETQILGDASMLQNALMNMGINASHAMPNGGVLTYLIENTTLDEEYCLFSPFTLTPGEYIEIAVRDTGEGMEPEISEHIFEPFFTTKSANKGTGLGLAAVYGAVQEHKGAINVYSEKGVGTVFHIYIPTIKGADEVKDVPQAQQEMRATGAILIVDDEELIRKTTEAMLKSMGFTVYTACDGVEGIELFKKHIDEIDIVILDMIMPKMGGREAFDNLRAIKKDLPILIASGFAKDEDISALQSSGPIPFLHKPFRRAELFGAIKRVIDSVDKTS